MDPSFPPVSAGRVADAVRAEISGDPSALVAEAAYDSRDVRPGSIFFCIRGSNTDGHAFAGAAVAAGATVIALERWLDLDVTQLLVPSVRQTIGPMSAVVFGEPAVGMALAGVTGTNGKTTVTYLLEAVLRGAGRVPGVIGTTGAHVDGTPVPLARTTPEAPDLQRLFAEMRRRGVQAVAMEVSSHALAQHRVDGTRFDVAVFTNLSQDHLDFHPTMEDYFAAKARLFTPTFTSRGVVNAGDPYGRRLLASPAVDLTSFGVEVDADLVGEDVRVGVGGSSFRVRGVEVRTPLRGRFNVENCIAALAASDALGIDLDVAAEAIAGVADVPGRMEPVEAGQDFLVVVDYAHTPDSILGVLRGARPLSSGRVIVVFGCGGDRDRAKRPLMGRAATSEADLTIVTSDNPRSEDPIAIIDEVVRGAEEGGGLYVVEPDRRAAIALAVREAGPGDVVVIAGKGHERVQELADGPVPFDDREVAADALRTLRGAS